MDLTITPLAKRDQTEAILKLLSDEDEATVSMVLEQLELKPQEAAARLGELLPKASGQARRVLLSELERVQIGDPAQALKASCQSLHNVTQFEDFCWKMAFYEDPKAQIYESRERLDVLAKRVEKELVANAGPHEQLAALRLVLSEEERFRGNKENYYDPANSFLDKVIRTHLGWPTSLSALYMLVGHRVGIPVEPVCFPGHFLARIGSCYFAPFTGAESVERSMLEEKLLAEGFNSDYDILDRTPLPVMAQRMVNNLVTIFTKADDIDNLLRWQVVLTWLQEVSID